MKLTAGETHTRTHTPHAVVHTHQPDQEVYYRRSRVQFRYTGRDGIPEFTHLFFSPGNVFRVTQKPTVVCLGHGDASGYGINRRVVLTSEGLDVRAVWSRT